jgi:hypothetical protein
MATECFGYLGTCIGYVFGVWINTGMDVRMLLRDGLTGGGCTPLIVRRVSTGLENPGKSLN